MWDNGNQLMRANKGQCGIQTCIYMKPTDPDDPPERHLDDIRRRSTGRWWFGSTLYHMVKRPVHTPEARGRDLVNGRLTDHDSAGIMCFGNIAFAFGGVMYANSGVGHSTMTCQGVAAIDISTVNQDSTRNGCVSVVGMLNSTSAGLTKHIQFNGSGRVTFNRTNTSI